MENRDVLFIGAGRMAQAMIRGITLGHGGIHWRISVANRSNEEKRSQLVKNFGVTSVAAWQDAVETADVIILAMPPQAHRDVLQELAGRLQTNQLVLSVAAGIGIRGLVTGLGPAVATAWCMPNTAVAVGASMTLLALGERVTSIQRVWLLDILKGLGEVELCSEADIHQWTAITGSAPAFVFQFAHVLEQFAAAHGMTAEQARRLVGQMMLGSAQLLVSGRPSLELSDEVTTPGGSTAAGHAVLAEHGWQEALRTAMVAVQNHARNGQSAPTLSQEHP